MGTQENARTRCVSVKPSMRRHHDVEQRELGGVRLDRLQRRLPVTHRAHLVAVDLQVARDQPQELGLVVGGHNRRLLGRHTLAAHSPLTRSHVVAPHDCFDYHSVARLPVWRAVMYRSQRIHATVPAW
jgi:hypothetical protein